MTEKLLIGTLSIVSNKQTKTNLTMSHIFLQGTPDVKRMRKAYEAAVSEYGEKHPGENSPMLGLLIATNSNTPCL